MVGQFSRLEKLNREHPRMKEAGWKKWTLTAPQGCVPAPGPLAKLVATAEWWLENTIRHTSWSTRESLGNTAGCLSECVCVCVWMLLKPKIAPDYNLHSWNHQYSECSLFRIELCSTRWGCVYRCSGGVYVSVHPACAEGRYHQDAAGSDIHGPSGN